MEKTNEATLFAKSTVTLGHLEFFPLEEKHLVPSRFLCTFSHTQPKPPGLAAGGADLVSEASACPAPTAHRACVLTLLGRSPGRRTSLESGPVPTSPFSDDTHTLVSPFLIKGKLSDYCTASGQLG